MCVGGAYGILVLRPRIEQYSALGGWSLNHWTAKEVLEINF